jgi:hypothetical protein
VLPDAPRKSAAVALVVEHERKAPGSERSVMSKQSAVCSNAYGGRGEVPCEDVTGEQCDSQAVSSAQQGQGGKHDAMQWLERLLVAVRVRHTTR